MNIKYAYSLSSLKDQNNDNNTLLDKFFLGAITTQSTDELIKALKHPQVETCFLPQIAEKRNCSIADVKNFLIDTTKKFFDIPGTIFLFPIILYRKNKSSDYIFFGTTENKYVHSLDDLKVQHIVPARWYLRPSDIILTVYPERNSSLVPEISPEGDERWNSYLSDLFSGEIPQKVNFKF